MEERENADGLSAQELERREMPRCAVDEEANLLLVNHGSSFSCRVVELSLSGCRMRMRQQLRDPLNAAVEASFKVQGIAFRLGGLLEWTAGANLAGVSFGPMSSRRRDDLMEVLCEVEAKNAAEAEKEASQARLHEDGERAQIPPGPRVAAEEIASKNKPVPIDRPVLSPRPFAGAEMIFAATPSLPAKTHSAPQARAPEAAVTKPASPVPAAPVPASQIPASQNAAGPAPVALKGPERRADKRCGVDTSAVIDLVKIGSKLEGQILDLSVGGCRIHTVERFPVGIYTRVETEFRLQGLPFRLGGVIQAIHNRNLVGIRFLDVSPRKREQVSELIDEIVEMRAAGGPDESTAQGQR
jgi:c-di-GMP-binding flagellar brake protein YcgR